MSSILPYDIIVHIIDTVGEDKDLLKNLSLVSHSFHQLCCKHLFATVGIHNPPRPDLKRRDGFTKKSFVNLLKSRPDVVQYIRKLTYTLSYYSDDDFQLSHILPKFLRTISRLNCLTIDGSNLNWNLLSYNSRKMEPSLRSALLYLMHLPSINHIDLSNIRNFPLSILLPCVNLLRLDIRNIKPLEEQVMEKLPKIREFRTSDSALLTTKLLHAIKQDGQPVFNIMDLRQLSICLGDKQNIRYLLQNAKLLEKLHLSLVSPDQSFEGLHDILSASACTLNDLSISLCPGIHLRLEGFCEALETMAGRNMLEALSLEVNVYRYMTADPIGSFIQSVEKILVKPGWPALRKVSFKVPVVYYVEDEDFAEELARKLQFLLPDTYLSHLSKLESVALNVSSYTFKPRRL